MLSVFDVFYHGNSYKVRGGTSVLFRHPVGTAENWRKLAHVRKGAKVAVATQTRWALTQRQRTRGSGLSMSLPWSPWWLCTPPSLPSNPAGRAGWLWFSYHGNRPQSFHVVVAAVKLTPRNPEFLLLLNPAEKDPPRWKLLSAFPIHLHPWEFIEQLFRHSHRGKALSLRQHLCAVIFFFFFYLYFLSLFVCRCFFEHVTEVDVPLALKRLWDTFKKSHTAQTVLGTFPQNCRNVRNVIPCILKSLMLLNDHKNT